MLSSSEQLKVAAALMLKSDPAHDVGTSTSTVVGREGQELRKIRRRVGRVSLPQTDACRHCIHITYEHTHTHTQIDSDNLHIIRSEVVVMGTTIGYSIGRVVRPGRFAPLSPRLLGLMFVPTAFR